VHMSVQVDVDDLKEFVAEQKAEAGGSKEGD
jgi:hypothetical protein